MAPKLGFLPKFWFGFGQAAEGMKNAAFNAFLLVFYSQVLGLPAYLGGIALGVSLLLDAVTDPLTGSLSDALRHRWGRRHPFMYAAAIPMWITFALAFRPPQGMGELGLFLWMVTFTVLARLAMTLYHVPHLALGAELSDDYDERTAVVAYRQFFGLMGAASVFLIGRQLFFLPSEAFPQGELNPAAYPPMAMAFGAAMAIAIFLSALGTHSRIPYLPEPGSFERFSLGRVLGELRDALRNRSFFFLFSGVLIFFVSRGVAQTLDIYMGTFFWRLETSQVLTIPLAGFFGIALGTPFWALIARGRDKKDVFVLCVVWYSVLTFLLPVAKITGFYPPVESFWYVNGIYLTFFVAAFGAAGSLVAAGSMMADIADEHELKSGHRQEGIFFGALSFSGKAAVGAGSLLAGLGLTLIAFPLQVEPDQVPPQTALQLGILAGPGVAVLMGFGVALMIRYELSKERVARVQAELMRRREEAAARPAAEVAAPSRAVGP